MKTIVTQFLRPHGQERPVAIEISDEAEAKWRNEIEPLGLRLTAEIIPGGGQIEDQVCVCIENREWGDYRMTLQPNIPEAPVTKEIDEMIMKFDKSEYDAWLQELTADE